MKVRFFFVCFFYSHSANEGNIITWPSSVSSDGTPNLLHKDVKTCMLTYCGTVKAPREWQGERTCLWSCQCSPHFKLLVYYCSRKLVITTGQLPDLAHRSKHTRRHTHVRTHARARAHEGQRGEHIPAAPLAHRRKAMTCICAAISESSFYYPPATHGRVLTSNWEGCM